MHYCLYCRLIHSYCNMCVFVICSLRNERPSLDIDVMFESSGACEFHPYSTWALSNCARAPQRLPARVRLRLGDEAPKSLGSSLRLAVEVRLGAPYEGWKQVAWVPSRAHTPLLHIGQPNELACLLLSIRLSASYEPSFHVVVFRA